MLRRVAKCLWASPGAEAALWGLESVLPLTRWIKVTGTMVSVCSVPAG